MFAGLLIQGGVISYDTNTFSGGLGARYLGIGSSKQYREDSVSVSVRLVSVSTGEILMEVMTSKSILSVGLTQDLFRFLEEGTELVEVEGGVTENESVSIALQKAIEDMFPPYVLWWAKYLLGQLYLPCLSLLNKRHDLCAKSN